MQELIINTSILDMYLQVNMHSLLASLFLHGVNASDTVDSVTILWKLSASRSEAGKQPTVFTTTFQDE